MGAPLLPRPETSPGVVPLVSRQSVPLSGPTSRDQAPAVQGGMPFEPPAPPPVRLPVPSPPPPVQRLTTDLASPMLATTSEVPAIGGPIDVSASPHLATPAHAVVHSVQRSLPAALPSAASQPPAPRSLLSAAPSLASHPPVQRSLSSGLPSLASHSMTPSSPGVQAASRTISRLQGHVASGSAAAHAFSVALPHPHTVQTSRAEQGPAVQRPAVETMGQTTTPTFTTFGSPSAPAPVVQRTPGETTVEATNVPVSTQQPDGPNPPGPSGGRDLDDLSRRLYDRIRDHLWSELRLDRERAGMMTDLTC
jgi:hypothetical protein